MKLFYGLPATLIAIGLMAGGTAAVGYAAQNYPAGKLFRRPMGICADWWTDPKPICERRRIWNRETKNSGSGTKARKVIFRALTVT